MQMSGKITLSLPSLVIVFDPKLMVLNGEGAPDNR